MDFYGHAKWPIKCVKEAICRSTSWKKRNREHAEDLLVALGCKMNWLEEADQQAFGPREKAKSSMGMTSCLPQSIHLHFFQKPRSKKCSGIW